MSTIQKVENLEAMLPIPFPRSISQYQEKCIIHSEILIDYTQIDHFPASAFTKALELFQIFHILISASHSSPEVTPNPINNNEITVITLEITDNEELVFEEKQADQLADFMHSSGYCLEIKNDSSTKNPIMHISALNTQGLFYGVQSLLQILFSLETSVVFQKSESNSISWEVPAFTLNDYPEYEWRGFMLDVGRHFFSVEEIKKYLDLMAIFKMNVFHWHLTEDQGWRFESKKYPRLIEIGATRNHTQIGGFLSKKQNDVIHQGFYTQDQIREIVQYAADRFILVVPEIEMPGHSSAALAAYPEFGCLGDAGNYKVQSTFGIKKDIYCIGNPKTLQFLKDILDEVIELFPGPYIHIGGDEAPKVRWETCPKCQELKRTENIPSEHAMQAWFTNEMVQYLEDNGKHLVGWNEILQYSLDARAIGQFWTKGKPAVIQHLKKGGKIIMSNFFHVYLDYDYVVTPLRKTYKYSLALPEVPHDLAPSILGVETPMWTEFARNNQRLEWQTLPRMIAVAEIGWLSERDRNYSRFFHSLQLKQNLLKKWNFNYASLDVVDPKWYKRLFMPFHIGKEADIPNDPSLNNDS